MGEKTILLVEDNPDDVELVKRSLRQGNIANRIDLARDGAEAIEYLHGERAADRLPEVVLLDLRLPKVSGLEVLRRIRAEERTRLLPVVILTSSDEERDVVESYNLGANGFVKKPVEFDEFAEAVRHLGLYWVVLNRPAAGTVADAAGR